MSTKLSTIAANASTCAGRSAMLPILLAVGWYLRFSLSYRDVEELLAERGLRADHVTVWRWVQRYAPEPERRLRSRLNSTNDSWRVDETYPGQRQVGVFIPGKDSTGATSDFLLSAKRDTAAAKRFLAKALGGGNHPHPRVINTNKEAAYPPAIVELKARGPSGGELPASTCALSQQCARTGSSGHQASGPRESAFSLLLGSLAHDRRLRSDSYDPQRSGVLECGGCEGRSAAPLHSRSVRGDELNLQSPRPTFASTTNLQHFHYDGG